MSTTEASNLPELGKLKASWKTAIVGDQFPVPLRDTKSLTSLHGKWPNYVGQLRGPNVILKSSADIELLRTLGCYGMYHSSDNSMTRLRGSATAVKQCHVEKSESQTQCGGNYCDEGEISDDSWSEEPWEIDNEAEWPVPNKIFKSSNESSASANAAKIEETSDNRNLTLRSPIKREEKYLVLSSVETFYLASYLNCLTVVRSNKNVIESDVHLWQHFLNLDPRFPALLAVYLHFRARGWSVRHGMRMGVHFLLYAISPDVHHAAYSVVVEMTRAAGEPAKLSLLDLASRLRVTANVSKKLILCRVDYGGVNLDSPQCIERFSLQVLNIDRMTPTSPVDSKSINTSGLHLSVL